MRKGYHPNAGIIVRFACCYGGVYRYCYVAVETSLAMWEEMKNGTELGQTYCIRAKIDMASDNGCLRDPTMYRCRSEVHVETGSKYKLL